MKFNVIRIMAKLFYGILHIADKVLIFQLGMNILRKFGSTLAFGVFAVAAASSTFAAETETEIESETESDRVLFIL